MNESEVLVPVAGKKYKRISSGDIIEVLFIGSKTFYAKIIQSDNESHIGFEYAMSLENFSRYFVEYEEPKIHKKILVVIQCYSYSYSKKYFMLFDNDIELHDYVEFSIKNQNPQILAKKYVSITEGEFENE